MSKTTIPYHIRNTYIGQEITLAAGRNLVTLFNQKNGRIATHLRVVNATGEYRTEASHYPPHKSKSQTEYQAEHAKAMQDIGCHAAGFFTGYKEKHGNYWVRGIKGIIRLAGKYDRHIVDLACKRAMEFEAYSYAVVHRICQTGLWQDGEQGNRGEQDGEQQNGEQQGVTAQNRNGDPAPTEQTLLRPLEYYSRLYLIHVFFFFLHLHVHLHVRFFTESHP